MKKSRLVFALIVLGLFELCLLTALLPDSWQRAINDQVSRVFSRNHDQSVIAHPAMDKEIEQVLREHPGFRIISYAVWGVLLLGSTALIWKTWRAIKRRPSAS